MNLRRIENANYTPEQVEQHVRQAVALADDCQLSESDRAVLLPAILDKLASKQVLLEQLPGLDHMAIPRGLG